MTKARAEFEIHATDRTRTAFGAVDRRMQALQRRGGELTLAIGATTAAFAAATVKAVNHANQIAKTARAAGFASDSYQELVFTMSQFDISTEKTNSSLERFTKRIGEAANGTGAAAREYERLGIAVSDGDGNIRSSEDVLRDVADAMQRMETQAERAASSAALFGREGIRMGLALSGGSAELDEFGQTAHELGLVLDTNLLRKAEDASDQLDRMQRIVAAQATVALSAFFPVVVSVGEAFAEASTHARRFFDYLNDDSALRIEGRIGQIREQIAELMGEIESGRVDRSQAVGAFQLGGFSDAEGRRLTNDEVSERLDEASALIEVMQTLQARLDSLNGVGQERAAASAFDVPALGAPGDAAGADTFDPARAAAAAQAQFDAIHEARLAAAGREEELELFRRDQRLERLAQERQDLVDHNALTQELEDGFRVAREEAAAASEARITQIRDREAKRQAQSEQQLQQQITSFRMQATQLGLSALREFASGHRGFQLALLAAEKAYAIADVLIRGHQAAMLARATYPEPAGEVLAQKQLLLSRVSAGFIAATGLAQAAGAGGGGGGGGASLGGGFGVPQDRAPAGANPASLVEEGETNAASVQVVLSVNGGDAPVVSALMDAIEVEVREGDRVIVPAGSRNALELQS